MDPITQISQKIIAERARQAPQQQQQPAPEAAPPPPYENTEDDSDSDDDEPEDEESSTPAPLKLTINAAHSIQGSNNLIPTSPTPLADATRFSTVLLHAVNQINNAAQSRRTVKVDLTINCGITVIGDRNVIGNVGLRPKAAATIAAGAPPSPVSSDGGSSATAVAGAKRKAEDDINDDEPEQKKLAVENVPA